MRLVIKEYLSRLKEKDELDFLICDLLLQMGYIMDNRPETGNRQYGWMSGHITGMKSCSALLNRES